MFTGIVTAVGEVVKTEPHGRDCSLLIRAGKLDVSDTDPGESICVNGVCLTVTGLDGDRFSVDISAETLSCTTLGTLSAGSSVNLEKALRASDRLGGHIVSGHVDGVGTIKVREGDARSTRYQIEVPGGLSRYICRKGSVCVDGVSLTVNDVAGDCFEVNIVPHTMQETVFPSYQTGSRVNIEVDIIARYLERLSAFE